MRKLGIVTVGQSPRTDVMVDLMPLLGRGIEPVEYGALDELDDFAALAPCEGEAELTSRLRDGGSVTVSETKVLPLMQRAVDRTVAAGAEAVVVLCTALPDSAITASVPLVFPHLILRDAVATDAAGRPIAVIVPHAAQADTIGDHWESATHHKPHIFAASPYDSAGDRIAVATIIATTDAACVVLDCIGYSVAMGDEIARICGKEVVVPRTLIAAAALDALGE